MVTHVTPRTIAELKSVSGRIERIVAATAYIEHGTSKVREARGIRDDDIRALADEHGPSEAARLAGVSLATVKLIRGRR